MSDLIPYEPRPWPALTLDPEAPRPPAPKGSGGNITSGNAKRAQQEVDRVRSAYTSEKPASLLRICRENHRLATASGDVLLTMPSLPSREEAEEIKQFLRLILARIDRRQKPEADTSL